MLVSLLKRNISIIRQRMKLKLGRHSYHFPHRTLIMGILNVTPDSFSDGGQYCDVESACLRAAQMVEEGADWIDVGGESTRPGADEISEVEEARRVFPVIEAICELFPNLPISIDTRKPGVAQGALARGASLVNDVEANRKDPAMWRLVADTGAGYVVMHMKGVPQNMQSGPIYSSQGVTLDVSDFFDEKMTQLQSCGVSPDQVILDVGIGFGKTVEHNVELMSNLNVFSHRERPLLIGASRKSFLGHILNAPLSARLSGSLACAAWAVMAGSHILRVHDVRETTHVVRLIETFQSKNI
jgi:dihydropteroate synthase